MSPTADGAERLPPQNRDAERSVLGSMLRDNSVISSVVQIVRADDFYEDGHRKIFDAIVAINDKGGKPVDLVILTDELHRRGHLEDVGSYAYLSELWDAAPTAANAEYYARIVRDKAITRNLIHATYEIQRDAYDQSQPADELLGDAERRIMQIAQMGISGQTVTLEEAIHRAYIRLDKLTTGEQQSSGISTGFLDLDEITAGLHESELIIIAARPSVGKCLPHDAEVVLADGSVQTMEEIYRRRQARLLTLLPSWRFDWTAPSAYVDDGIKPVFRVTTRLGRTVEATLSHPFLTVKGWRPLANLTVGDSIAVPRVIPVFGNEQLRECEVRVLAHVLSDGPTARRNARLQADFADAVSQCGARSGSKGRLARRASEGLLARRASEGRHSVPLPSLAHRANENPRWRVGLTRRPALTRRGLKGSLADTAGSVGHARSIPAIVFRLTRPLLALFLNRLFTADGWATTIPNGHTSLGYSTSSERMARQVQHLLLRFGILSKLHQDTRRRAWSIHITAPRAVQTFATAIGMLGKEDTFRTYQESAPALADKELLQLAQRDIYWDTIVSIEPVGRKQVYDLTIPETHNFVANDVCVHNTAFSLNLVRNIIIDQKEAVFFVSLEQSATELAERLLCSQARVDSHRLRKGTLSSEDMDKLMAAGSQLSSSKLFIDDAPFQGMLRIAANARRLKMRHNLKLIVIDYLQLIEPDNRRDPRQEQVAQISRRLKALAKELQMPVIALAQVNRSSEDRQDHRPRLADLRESGCLAGDTLVTLADFGARIPIRDLVGRSGFTVWALDEVTFKLKPAEVEKAFATGRKPVYRLLTRLGRTLRATGNHKFRTLQGWQRLDELRPGDRLALPYPISEPRPQGSGWGKSSPPLPCGRGSEALAVLAPETVATISDEIYWDEIVSIEPAGEDDVFDLTVPGPANFVAGDIICHNSIEQDADTVMLLHRPDRYEPGQHEGIIEVIIGKQRNGPTGEVTLAYLKQYMRYENYAAGTPFDG